MSARALREIDQLQVPDFVAAQAPSADGFERHRITPHRQGDLAAGLQDSLRFEVATPRSNPKR